MAEVLLRCDGCGWHARWDDQDTWTLVCAVCQEVTTLTPIVLKKEALRFTTGEPTAQELAEWDAAHERALHLGLTPKYEAPQRVRVDGGREVLLGGRLGVTVLPDRSLPCRVLREDKNPFAR